MIDEHVLGIIQIRKEIEEKWDIEIKLILRENGPCTPSEILNHLKEKKRKEIEKDYYSGKISKNEFETRIDSETIKRETIQRKLKKLIASGHVIKDQIRYSLSEIAFTELKFFDTLMGKRYGNSLLLQLLILYTPVNKTIEKKVEDIISVFGVFLLFSAIEACRPIELDNGNKTIGNDIKERISLQWFKNSLNPELILNSFICTLGRNFDYKDRNHFIEKYSYLIDQDRKGSDEIRDLKKRFLEPLTGMDLYDMHFLDTQLNGRELDNKIEYEPRFQISQDRADELKEILEKMYPNVYYLVQATCHKLFENSKESYFGVK